MILFTPTPLLRAPPVASLPRMRAVHRQPLKHLQMKHHCTVMALHRQLLDRCWKRHRSTCTGWPLVGETIAGFEANRHGQSLLYAGRTCLTTKRNGFEVKVLCLHNLAPTFEPPMCPHATRALEPRRTTATGRHRTATRRRRTTCRRTTCRPWPTRRRPAPTRRRPAPTARTARRRPTATRRWPSPQTCTAGTRGRRQLM